MVYGKAIALCKFILYPDTLWKVYNTFTILGRSSFIMNRTISKIKDTLTSYFVSFSYLIDLRLQYHIE